MAAERVPFHVGDDVFDLHVERPADASAGERRPVVFVCHAWAGRGPHEESRARQLAELGYVGVAIDLYGVGRRCWASSSASPSSCVAGSRPRSRPSARCLGSTANVSA